MKNVERTVSGLHSSLFDKLRESIDPSWAVLDVGCGTGAWLKRLATLELKELHGLDYDVSQISINTGSFAQADLDKTEPWPVGDNQFDLITAIEVIEHLSNIGHFFSEISRVMKPDAMCLLTTPNILSLACRMRFLWTADLKQFGRIGDATHLFPIVPATLPRVLERYDLELVETWGYPASGRTLTSRRVVNTATKILRKILPEPVPGDILCMVLRRRTRG